MGDVLISDRFGFLGSYAQELALFDNTFTNLSLSGLRACLHYAALSMQGTQVTLYK